MMDRYLIRQAARPRGNPHRTTGAHPLERPMTGDAQGAAFVGSRDNAEQLNAGVVSGAHPTSLIRMRSLRNRVSMTGSQTAIIIVLVRLHNPGLHAHSSYRGLQRERARHERIRQREFREFHRSEARTVREAAKAERDRKRQAATGERERKKLYVEDRKAEAAAMAEDVRAGLAELDGLLKAGIRDRPVVTFASLRRTDDYPAFDPGQLGEPVPPPIWEQFAPAPPSGLGKVFGGGGRFERQAEIARAAYAQVVEQHTAAEAERRRQLGEQRAAYDSAAAAFAADVAEHNAGIDQFQRDCRAGDPEAVAQFCTLVLDSSVYPDGFPHQTRVVYRPDQREAVVE